MEIFYYVLLILIIIFIISYVYVYVYDVNDNNSDSDSDSDENNNDKIIEGLKFPKIGDIRKTVTSGIKKGVSDPINYIKKKVENTEKQVSSVGKNVRKISRDTLGRFRYIINGLKNTFSGIRIIFKGIGENFTGLGDGLKRGFDDIGELISYTGEFLLTYSVCGVKFIGNLSKCLFYYLTDALLQILYLPIRIALYIIWLFFYKGIYRYEKDVWKLIAKVDAYFYSIFQFHFLKWPRSVRNLCYNCKRLKVKVLKNKAKEVDNDFKTKIKEDLRRGIKTIERGANKIEKSF